MIHDVDIVLIIWGEFWACPKKLQPLRLPKRRRQRRFDAKGRRPSSGTGHAVMLPKEANELSGLQPSCIVYTNEKWPMSWEKWIRILGHFSHLTSLVKRWTEWCTVDKACVSCPDKREDIIFDDGRWDHPKLTKPAKPRTYASFISTDKFKDPRSLPKPSAPFSVSKKLVLVQTNGFAVILLHRLEDVHHALLSIKMSNVDSRFNRFQ